MSHSRRSKLRTEWARLRFVDRRVEGTRKPSEVFDEQRQIQSNFRGQSGGIRTSPARGRGAAGRRGRSSVGIDAAGQHDRRRAPANRESRRHRVRADAQVGALRFRAPAPERGAGAVAQRGRAPRLRPLRSLRLRARRAACARRAGCARHAACACRAACRALAAARARRAACARLEARCRCGARGGPAAPLRADASRFVRRDAGPRDRAQRFRRGSHRRGDARRGGHGARIFRASAARSAGERITLARPSRPGSWYLKVAGLTAVALLMVGGAVAMKIGMPGLHKSPPLILAADGPSKIAPPNEATVQSAGDTGALLLKDSAAPTPSPVKLVSTEEQPVDLLAQTPAPAPKPPAADAQSAPAPMPPAADAQSAPAPKSPASDGQLAPAPNTPIVAPSEGLGGAPASDRTLFPSAKRVKTVSVRPDGTLISSDTAPDAPIAQSPAPTPSPAPVAPARKPENAGAAALAATPTIELPAKPAPKSSARVNVAKTDASAPADAAIRRCNSARRPRMPSSRPRRPSRSPPSSRTRRRPPPKPTRRRNSKPHRRAADGRFSSRARAPSPRRRPPCPGSRVNTAAIWARPRSACTRPKSTATPSIASGPAAFPKPMRTACAPS